VLRDIELELDLGGTVAGLLTSAPLLMFALLTPLAALFIRRAGAELALLFSLAGVFLGTLVRALPGFGGLMAGMLVIGIAVTIGNVVIPVIVRRDVPPRQVEAVMASYVAMLNAGSLLTTLLTAPLASVVGWRVAVLSWSAITLLGIVLWSIHLRRTRRSGSDWGDRFSGAGAGAGPAGGSGGRADTLTGPVPVVSGNRGSVLRRPIGGLLMGVFAVQCFMYYALTTWLPSIAGDLLGVDRAAAGALASIFQGIGILGGLLVPVLSRYTPRLVPATVIALSWVVLTVGMLVEPELLWLWLGVGAVGHAGGFVVVFTTLVGVARSDAEAGSLSAFVQAGGYVVGCLGGPVLGGLHELTGGWIVPLVVMVVMAVGYAVVLLTAVITARRATV
jgi:MFS transporter, CP family, cyanate transporter